MDSISIDRDTPLANVKRAVVAPATKEASAASNAADSAANLTDVSALAAKVDAVGESDVRPEAVERGKALISDPNWPSDDILDKLSEKLLDHEDFS